MAILTESGTFQDSAASSFNMLTLEFWPVLSKYIFGILAPSLFQTLEFWPCFYKLWISGPHFTNMIGILAVCL